MIRYEIDKNDIFKVWFEGKISYSDIKEYLDAFKTINNLPLQIKLLYDFTKVQINMLEDDLKEVAGLAAEATKKFFSVRTAFLVADPDIMAFTQIFTQLELSERHKRYIFTSYQAAEDWLLEA